MKLFRAAMGSNAETGVFQFITADGKYKIKSITAKQKANIIRNLDAYIQHLRDT